MTKRFGGDFSKATLHHERLDQPLRWRKPRRIFVCSMGDLFHEDVPRDFIDRVFDVMTLRRDHTFLLLTKRPQRSSEYLSQLASDVERWPLPASERAYRIALATLIRSVSQWPLPNVWLGVSVENQRAAEERVPLLLQTPATVRFLSCEPLLEAVNLRSPLQICPHCLGGTVLPFARDERGTCSFCHGQTKGGSGLDWVIAGGESGPDARPARQWWFQELLWQCRGAGVPLFIKQLGSVLGRELGCRDRKGGDMDAWPEDLRVREWPT